MVRSTYVPAVLATITLAWNENTHHNLLGCGVDVKPNVSPFQQRARDSSNPNSQEQANHDANSATRTTIEITERSNTSTLTSSHRIDGTCETLFHHLRIEQACQ